MSGASSNAAAKSTGQKSLPAWIISGVLGMAVGVAATYVMMYYKYGPELNAGYHGPGASTSGDTAATPGGGGMMPGGGGGMGMGGGGMGGGGGGGGMGGGGPRGKRNLTSLIGKLDLLGKGISFELTDEQSAKITSQLDEIEVQEKMTQEEAQQRVDTIEAILTDDQKETLSQFDMPRGGGGGGGMGGGGGGGGGMAGGMGGGQGPEDDNPFRQQATFARLKSLRDKLNGASADTPSPTEKVESNKTDQ